MIDVYSERLSDLSIPALIARSKSRSSLRLFILTVSYWLENPYAETPYQQVFWFPQIVIFSEWYQQESINTFLNT
ncbi:hypothetical protein AM1_E0048 (plasmid) [Acaryochloris marina MBIC11017]|uniref:Uncharacterized protein n=1 Tax=Acaryochloris marina (strain MBIC 11017) TaxID=329726 RepID=A8ZP82_ACAM1|nr:hypothetical protein AM1_E0048 [Acaryochloris marina MBIC11017]